MKYDCSREFDIAIIYQKLTAPSLANTVKAKNFFEKKQSALHALQQKIAQVQLYKEGYRTDIR